MEQNKNRFIFVLAFLLLGLVVSVQFRSTLNLNKQKAASGFEVEQLNAMINEEKKTGEALKESIKKNEKLWDDSLKASIQSSDNSYMKRLLEELDAVKLKAGYTDVKGPGIILKLDDALVRKNMNQDLSTLIIHDSDIKKLLSEIKNAGAQAISINGERIISTSETICAGPTILINNNKYPVPYTIKVIGNPDILYKKVDESDRMAYMRRDGIRVSIEKSKEIEINKYGNDDLNRLVWGMEVIRK
jgi:uncharacterized protein YlxW (UPF0749 family)